MVGVEEEKSDMYKTKVINFRGRSVPIILQNDNGPCPLIAICNVLLLRNSITVRKEASEVSLQNLLTLVAERLLDSNSNNEGKDESYIQNRQQNIADAISLLPRLATGIDVNVRFRNIFDFEFTPECAIFDLLDIELVHGWLYDPQDESTAKAIGSKSYNVIVEKVVAMRSSKPDIEDEPTVDFAAATTASLGVPSPGLCTRRSFDALQFLDLNEPKEKELSPDPLNDPKEKELSPDSLKNPEEKELSPDSLNDLKEKELSPDSTSDDAADEQKALRKGDEEEAAQLLDALHLSSLEHPSAGAEESIPEETIDGRSLENLKQWPSLRVWATDGDPGAADSLTMAPEEVGRDTSTSSDFECLEVDDCRTASSNDVSAEGEKIELAREDGVVDVAPADEPLYEGETTFQSNGFEDREPLYEGEAVLVDAEPSGRDYSSEHSESEAETIESFLRINASQLTYYGLFSLQDGLQEQKLYVFFRNNHFSTLYKHEKELFLLVTDQGYLNQPDLVWEKLTEVDGDSVFFTGNFTLFKVDDQVKPTSWNEHEAMAATADFMSSQMGKPVPQQVTGDASYNSDLELAMALQQQEFEHQQPQPPQQPAQQQQQSPRKHSNSPRKGSGSRPSSALSTGRLFTGPSSSPPPKQEAKSKDKCRLM